MMEEQQQQPEHRNIWLQEGEAVPQAVKLGQGVKEEGQKGPEQIRCHLNIVWEVGEWP